VVSAFSQSLPVGGISEFALSPKAKVCVSRQKKTSLQFLLSEAVTA
jgi:hypothetical protein